MNALTEIQIEQSHNFSNCIVMHTQIKTIFNDFDELRLNRKFQTDQQCMLLIGDTGVGKNHTINHYKKRVLATQTYSRNTMPVLISRIFRGKGLDATLIQMLADLELFGSSQIKKRGYKTDLTKKLVESLIKAQVELLIINEFQELIAFKSIQERQQIANALKFVSEEAKVPIVLVGMPWAAKIAEEPQWASRLVRKRKLEYFSLKNDSKYFRQYLMGLAKKMPFDTPPKLENRHTTMALFAACRGQNRALKYLLSEALKLALSCNEYLENKHFITAYEKFDFFNDKEPLELKNPFEQDAKDIVIYEVIKSSSYNPNALDPEDMLIGPEFAIVK
ncbi:MULTISPECIES: TniB family NTP-binding protein [Pseudoalteromonas]|uniref:TniB family NTP-binding protein n=1 Tax=Pseudoalteromonas TaxID=53246 RepID=UPI001C9C75CE|nr:MULTISPECIES: TniB family NTP-binding protein [Pseudoalteromonas]MBZ2191431.1 TniB family NTP-binding protein [Pseudoalteromonas arctica]MCK8104895.1 TniB family NTP-binding protein [Pseudoalteromonas sp. 2CM36K]